MHVDLDNENDESGEPELITDPIIRRYRHRIHLLTMELIGETQNYTLNQVQINQLIDTLSTLRNLLVMAEDLERLDAMLRMSFPGDYYKENDNLTGMLTDYPLGRAN